MCGVSSSASVSADLSANVSVWGGCEDECDSTVSVSVNVGCECIVQGRA